MKISDKKKIIIIGPAYPYRGGNSLFISHIYDSLKDYFDVKIFNYKLLYPSFLFPGTSQYDKSDVLIKKAPSVRLVNSINPLNWISVAKSIIKENADLVVFNWWHPFFGPSHFSMSSLLRKKYRNKILFITENIVSHEGSAVDKILTKMGLSNASSFLALSDVVVKELQPLAGKRKIYRSELPVYDSYKLNSDTSTAEAKKKLGYKDSDIVLLFFGYIRKYKGLDVLIRSFPLIKKDIPEAKLLIVGEFYDDPAPYKKQVKDLKIENGVTIINNFVPNEEVGKYYQAADLVVLPYRSATQSGILNVAYGFTKPVLVTDVGGLAEFVIDKKTGIVVKPESPEEIFKGVKEFVRLNKEINFEENICSFIRDNKFNKLPEVFSEIIGNSKNDP